MIQQSQLFQSCNWLNSLWIKLKINNLCTSVGVSTTQSSSENPLSPNGSFGYLRPVREWLDGIQINSPKLARLICRVVPAQCPFERDINLFGQQIIHIPALCKLNPFYDQLVGLRFRALCYLVDQCGEDIQAFC